MRRLALLPPALMLLMGACTIEPPLRLPSDSDSYITLGQITTSIATVWQVEESWRDQWWYGWDDRDAALWGPLEYPIPTSYEARFYFYGEDPASAWSSLSRRTVYSSSWLHNLDYGFHDLTVWSNIDSPDGTQVVVINEDDPDNIFATTSQARVGYVAPRSAPAVRNIPEIFYANRPLRLHMSRDIADYDYFDSELNAWIKKYDTPLYPLVYIYLVQVVVYNNNGRILGTNDNAIISSLAEGVSILSGKTSLNPVAVAFPMRFKQDLPAPQNRRADIIGGRLHTFGLCGMEPWADSRGHLYAGARADLANALSLNIAFHNGTDSVLSYDITQQMRRQAHGGIITIEIDADTLTIPRPGGGGHASGFNPTIADGDSITHEFIM